VFAVNGGARGPCRGSARHWPHPWRTGEACVREAQGVEDVWRWLFRGRGWRGGILSCRYGGCPVRGQDMNPGGVSSGQGRPHEVLQAWVAERFPQNPRDRVLRWVFLNGSRGGGAPRRGGAWGILGP
jgi:hypothetical protein